jgi:lipopolysaccharide exporter
LKIYTKKILWFGFIVGVFPLILFLFFGQPVFVFVFGIKWLLAGKMAQFIALWFFLQILIGPVGFMLDIKQKLKYELNWNIILLVFRFLAILIGVMLNDLYLMLSIITAAGVLMYLFLLRYVFKLIKNEVK